jgi:hypothetical protein
MKFSFKQQVFFHIPLRFYRKAYHIVRQDQYFQIYENQSYFHQHQLQVKEHLRL